LRRAQEGPAPAPTDMLAVMKRVVVLGAGLVGRTMALDLASDPGLSVRVVDARAEALAAVRAQAEVDVERRDLGSPSAVHQVVQGADVVVGALSSAIGKQTLRAVLEAGRRYVDISFMGERAMDLGPVAKQHGACAVVDMGVGPGMTNMFAAQATEILSPCESLRIYLGGVPVVRTLPHEYKVAFAPSDVIEEYTRPARVKIGGRLVVKEPLGDVEHLDFEGVGTLEAFDTDGLRTLTETLDVPDMVEKTLRWPGHAAQMRMLKRMGFFDTKPVQTGDRMVAPIDVTSALLFEQWTYAPGEADLVVARVVAEGRRGPKRVRLVWEMVDRYDPSTRTSAMARTTGFPATIMARLLLAGRFKEPGVHPPEIPAKVSGLLGELLAELGRRGVTYRFREEHLGPAP